MSETNDAAVQEAGRGTRVCVIGAGAMGSVIGAGLLDAGAEVTLVDREERLAHLHRHGLTLHTPEGRSRTHRELRLRASEEAGDGYRFVFLAVKAYDLPDLAPLLPATLGPGSALVTLQNGIPWWYFQRYRGPLAGLRLQSLDPGGTLERHVDPASLIGCVPYPAAEVLPDGSVRQVEGHRLPVGELDGADTPRVRRLAALLEAAGFRARVLDDVRSEIWLKAWGNLAFNPLSALTGATLAEICRFAPTRRLAAEMMREAQAVGERLGARFRVGIERRIEGAASVGEHRTSMAQDLTAGRRLETEAIVGAVVELAEALAIPTPSIRAVHDAVQLLAHTRGQAGSEADASSRDAAFAALAAPTAPPAAPTASV